MAYTRSGALASQTIEDYKNSWSLATGAEYKYDDKWTFRGGVQYDQTPTGSHRDTRVPDGNRTWLGRLQKVQPDFRRRLAEIRQTRLPDEEVDLLTRLEKGRNGDAA